MPFIEKFNIFSFTRVFLNCLSSISVCYDTFVSSKLGLNVYDHPDIPWSFILLHLDKAVPTKKSQNWYIAKESLLWTRNILILIDNPMKFMVCKY